MRSARRQAGWIAGFILATFFGALLVATVTFDLFAVPRVPTDAPLAFTVRIPAMGTYRDTITGGASYQLLTIREVRGEKLSPKHARMVQAYEDLRRPPSPVLLLGLSAAALLLFLLFAAYLRGQGHIGTLLRTQVALFSALLLTALGGKALLILTGWSGFWIPFVALTMPITLTLGRRVGAATALTGAVMLSLLVPVDLPLLLVLCAEGLAASAFVQPHGGTKALLAGTAAATVAGVVTFAAISLLLVQYIPPGPLAAGKWTFDAILSSDLIAAAGAPIVGGGLALLISPILARALGQLSSAQLSKLANFEHPLLRKLATQAPGTWAHSLNMANLAEMAANAIGASGQLVRVGAYYHDLGKSIEPRYFIENQTGKNPHDEMPPEASADAIFSHVDGGVQLARSHGIPEAVTEFIYTHHATDRLEYFWHKNLKAGNALGLTEADFSYTGMVPRSRETGILAICDAVEAASRTLQSSDVESIRKLVRQIIFSKLEKGILDESDLSLADLRRVSESLISGVRGAMHGRVKYPWQEKDDAEQAAAASATKAADAASASEAPPETADEAKGSAAPAPAESTPKKAPTKAKAVVSPIHDADEPAWVHSAELPSEGRGRIATKPLGSKANDER